MEKIKNGLSNKVINMYGIPDLGFQMFINVELYYWSAFMTDYVKFSLATLSLILSITSIIDMIWVPLTGIILEKANFKWGKYRSWFLIGPPFVILFFTLMFTDFSFMNSEILATLIVIVSFSIKTLAQDVIYSGHVSQMSAISLDPDERTLLSARKTQYNTAGVLVFSAIGFATITLFGNLLNNEAAGYTSTAFLFTVIYAITCFILFKVTDKTVDLENAQYVDDDNQAKETLSIVQILKQTFTNPPLLAALLADTLRQLGRFLIIASVFYYFKIVFDNLALQVTYLLCVNIAGFIGSFLTAKASKVVGKKKAYMGCMIGCIVCLLLAYFFGKNEVIFIVLLSITMMLISPATAIVTAMIADTVSYTHLRRRRC